MQQMCQFYIKIQKNLIKMQQSVPISPVSNINMKQTFDILQYVDDQKNLLIWSIKTDAITLSQCAQIIIVFLIIIQVSSNYTHLTIETYNIVNKYIRFCSSCLPLERFGSVALEFVHII